MSELEKYILENREAFDQVEDVPEQQIWNNIKTGGRSHRPAPAQNKTWKWAAIAAFLLALAGWGSLFLRKPPPPQPSRPGPVAEARAMPVAPAAPVAPVVPPEAPTPVPTPDAKPVPKQGAAKPKKKKNRTAETPAPEVLPAQVAQLRTLVYLKKKEIGFDHLDRALFADLLHELDELEITIDQARKDFGSNPDNDRLVETLVKYYELKIRILELISNEINKRQYHEGLEKNI